MADNNIVASSGRITEDGTPDGLVSSDVRIREAGNTDDLVATAEGSGGFFDQIRKNGKIPTSPNPSGNTTGKGGATASPTQPKEASLDLNKKLDTRNFYDPHRLETFEDDYAVRAIPALFITTPMLNFDSANINENHFFKYLNDTDPDLLGLLSFGGRVGAGGSVNTSPFIKLLSNRFESFTTKATVSQPREVGETYYGFKQYLPGPTVNSISGDTVSIEYTETGGMEVLSLHKAWLDYIEGLSRGYLKPGATARAGRFLEFTSSIYLFSLAPDGETIVFYEKLTGCSPISVPYDVFSSKTVNDREIIKYSIEYTYSHKEDLNPRNLLTFNALTRSTAINAVTENLWTSPTMYSLPAQKPDLKNTNDFYTSPDMMRATTPIIVQAEDAHGRKVFKLKYTANQT